MYFNNITEFVIKYIVVLYVQMYCSSYFNSNLENGKNLVPARYLHNIKCNEIRTRKRLREKINVLVSQQINSKEIR